MRSFSQYRRRSAGPLTDLATGARPPLVRWMIFARGRNLRIGRGRLERLLSVRQFNATDSTGTPARERRRDRVGIVLRIHPAMASARKPVIVRKFSRDWCAGYAGLGISREATELEILDLNGKVLRMAWQQVKWVCYVRDLPSANGDQANPERILRKRFSIRPRTAGLWLRLKLADGDELEGLAANDLSLIEGPGLLLVPPDTRSNTQRIYVPRQAIQALEVLSLIGAPGRKRVAADAVEADQPQLFPGDSVSSQDQQP